MPNLLAIYCNNDRSSSYSAARKLLILHVEHQGKSLIASVCSSKGELYNVDVALLKSFRASRFHQEYLKAPSAEAVHLKLLYAAKDLASAKKMIAILTDYKNAKLKLMGV